MHMRQKNKDDMFRRIYYNYNSICNKITNAIFVIANKNNCDYK